MMIPTPSGCTSINEVSLVYLMYIVRKGSYETALKSLIECKAREPIELSSDTSGSQSNKSTMVYLTN